MTNVCADQKATPPRTRPARTQAGRDYVVPQSWEAFTADDHAVWDLLFARQVELLGSRVVTPFLDGIDLLRLSHPGRARPRRAQRDPEPRTGWRTVAVPGLVPDDIFFAMLSERVFPVGNFIRHARAARLSRGARLLPRLFGHIPMLAHHDFAEMIEHVGRLGSAAIAAGHGERVGADLLAQRRVRPGARGRRAEDPRRRARLELRRGAFQPRERRGRAAALLGRAARSRRPIATTRSSRSIWCRTSLEGRCAEILAH